MRTILVLLDSLNRHFLKMYNENTNTQTPFIDMFREDSVKFNQHFIGSAPCMPARRDILTGRLNFLDRCWGAIEPFDITFPTLLSKRGIKNSLITDHLHYVGLGGENYLQQFDTWQYIRGQTGDKWVASDQKPEMPEEFYGKVLEQYQLNRTKFTSDKEYPTPKTFETACQWIKDNKLSDTYFLMVEGFDPHEPFDCPDEYLELYEKDYKGPHYNWSGYDKVTEPEECTEHLRNCYKGTLSLTDRWFGKFIDTLKEHGHYEDSLIIFTTDHGHLLGEHGFTGKNLFPAYNEMCNIPLVVHLPNGKFAGEERDALTQNIDIMPTLLEYYGLEVPEVVRGKSLLPLLQKVDEKTRDACIYGWHGHSMNISDGKYTYFQAPNYNVKSYNYCAMPTTLWRYIVPENLDEIQMGRFLKYTKYPVYKFERGGKPNKNIMECQLFHYENDWGQEHPIQDANKIIELKGKMKDLLVYNDAPDELYEKYDLMNMK